MQFRRKIIMEEYALDDQDLTGFVRQRTDASGISRVDTSIYQYKVDCPELVIHRQKFIGKITKKHLNEAYSYLKDTKRCKQQWEKFKRSKEEK